MKKYKKFIALKVWSQKTKSFIEDLKYCLINILFYLNHYISNHKHNMCKYLLLFKWFCGTNRLVQHCHLLIYCVHYVYRRSMETRKENVYLKKLKRKERICNLEFFFNFKVKLCVLSNFNLKVFVCNFEVERTKLSVCKKIHHETNVS